MDDKKVSSRKSTLKTQFGILFYFIFYFSINVLNEHKHNQFKYVWIIYLSVKLLFSIRHFNEYTKTIHLFIIIPIYL